MNTFLPYPNFEKSAKCLDYKRLGKQRVEAWQIYNILKQGESKICYACEGTKKPTSLQLKGKFGKLISYCLACKGTGKVKTAWYNHPAVKMWKGYELALLFYAITMCSEWIKRGYKDTLRTKLLKEVNKRLDNKFELPKFIGNRNFHLAMKSNLLRKDNKYYSRFGWKVKNNLPYIWGGK